MHNLAPSADSCYDNFMRMKEVHARCARTSASEDGVKLGVHCAPTESGHLRRLKAWDYSKGASLFISISTEPRRPLFGKVTASGEVLLSPLGKAALEALEAMPRFNPGLSLFGHVVMPDHVHFNCHLAAGLAEPLKLLGKAIRGFKAVTTRAYLAGCQPANSCGQRPQGSTSVRAQCARTSTGGAGESGGGRPLGTRGAGESEGAGALRPHTGEAAPRRFPTIWQEGYHDHLCLSRGFIDSTERYIAYNGRKWALMHGAGALRIFEPLSSPRLDLGDYWKGVGNLALLDPAQPMVSLRISREVRDITAVVARMENAAEKGYTVASGFVSKGEQAVRDMLCSKAGARLIHVRPSCIPNIRFRPESAYVQAFAENRCLELGKGNEEVAFDRAACLDVNPEIIEMVKAGSGLSLYFKADGLYKLGSDGQWHKTV